MRKAAPCAVMQSTFSLKHDFCELSVGTETFNSKLGLKYPNYMLHFSIWLEKYKYKGAFIF